MPFILLCGALNSNTPQQNAGAFVGEFNFGGWDANIKLNQGHGGLYGFYNLIPAHLNINLDNMEGIDGAILDQDMKPIQSGNV